MIKSEDLTKGEIAPLIFKLAIPLMGTSFMQMAYQLMDLFWVGQVGTDGVSAIGVCGLYIWFMSSVVIISQVGISVGVSQNFGKGDIANAKKYINAGYKLNLILVSIMAFIVFFFRDSLLSFYNFKPEDIYVKKLADEYMKIYALGMVFNFMNPMFAVTLNSTGNSITPFKINMIGLICNMILDPILILTYDMNVKGAAIATVIAQITVTAVYIYLVKKSRPIYATVDYFEKADRDILKRILKLGLPTSLMNLCHSSVNIVLTRFIATFGAKAISAQAIGSEIEAISWMTSDGFATANAAFSGQNYGAGKYKRVHEGYKKSTLMISAIGMFASLLLIFGNRFLFKLFLPNDEKAIFEGARYLRILGFSQLFMAIEISTSGFFNGLGNTKAPSFNGLFFNIMRIPAAYILSGYFGISGIWMAISLSSIIKGIVSTIWFNLYMRKKVLIKELSL